MGHINDVVNSLKSKFKLRKNEPLQRTYQHDSPDSSADPDFDIRDRIKYSENKGYVGLSPDDHTRDEDYDAYNTNSF